MREIITVPRTGGNEIPPYVGRKYRLCRLQGCRPQPLPDNRSVARRVHVHRVSPGEVHLAAEQAHHLRDVLRLDAGDEIEVFDSDGHVATASITSAGTNVVLLIREVRQARNDLQLTVSSAIPKGDRADWMIEKLSEVGVTTFVPLRTARSVVHPEGKGKLDRWERIVIESAKQSRRAGVMKIMPLMTLPEAIAFTPFPGTSREGWAEGSDSDRADLAEHKSPHPNPLPPVRGRAGSDPLEIDRSRVRRLFLSTLPKAPSILQSIDWTASALDLFIGPEGGWSPEEVERFTAAGLTGASLTPTILRIETAAVAAAAVVATLFAQNRATT